MEPIIGCWHSYGKTNGRACQVYLFLDKGQPTLSNNRLRIAKNSPYGLLGCDDEGL